MKPDSYIHKQARRDADYEREYRAWVASLPEADRRALEKAGLGSPCVQRHGSGAASGDAADSPVMRTGDDPALLPNADDDHEGAELLHIEAVHQAIRRVIAEILCHDNARLTAECVALVSGLAYSGASMTEIAKRHGVTRAAVSKRCVELTELLDLRPSRAMRSLTARKSYREARLRSARSREHPDSIAS